MNVLMQLRKVCNHPDLFEARDYCTPVFQQFQIILTVPYLVMSIFSYDHLKTINLSALHLLLSEFETNTMLAYFSLLELYPFQHLPNIFKEIALKRQTAYVPCFESNENEVLFKRRYADSTILYKSNIEETYEMLRSSSSVYANFNYMPKFVCSTNIPLLNENSLETYFDIFDPLDESREYIKSVFAQRVKDKRKLRDTEKMQMFASLDLQFRKAIYYRRPIYGADLMRLIKLNIFPGILGQSKCFAYGGSFDKLQQLSNCSSILNKGFVNCCTRVTSFNTIFESTNEQYTMEVEANNVQESQVGLNPIESYLQESNKIEDSKITPELPKETQGFKVCRNLSNIPFVTEIKEDFIKSGLQPKDTIFHLFSENQQNLIFNPQKYLAICDELMQNYRSYIPVCISSGPKLVVSKLSQLNEVTY